MNRPRYVLPPKRLVRLERFTTPSCGSTWFQKLNSNEDTRIFLPYRETGKLIFGNADRFLASTPSPLPEGLCGGPAIDSDGSVCGVVEGIIPENHHDKQIAGAASFIPSVQLGDFIEFAEEVMLKEIFDEKMFDMVVDFKKGLGASEVEYKLDGQEDDDNRKKEEKELSKQMTSAFDERIESLKKHHTMEEVNAILTTIRRERDEAMDIWNREGGDLDEIVARVRAKTRAIQRELLKGLDENERREIERIIGKSSSDGAASKVMQAEFEEKKEGS